MAVDWGGNNVRGWGGVGEKTCLLSESMNLPLKLLRHKQGLTHEGLIFPSCKKLNKIKEAPLGGNSLQSLSKRNTRNERTLRECLRPPRGTRNEKSDGHHGGESPGGGETGLGSRWYKGLVVREGRQI